MPKNSVKELLDIAPKLNMGIDITTLDLDAHQGYVLSRIDGLTEAKIISDLVNIPPQSLVNILKYLEKTGAITWSGNDSTIDETDYAKDNVSEEIQTALNEKVDIPRAEKLRILKMESELTTKNYWELLELYDDPNASDIKKAYFDLSKKYHPDRFFGKKLGSYNQRLQKIFKAIKKAYDVLGDAKQKAMYQTQIPVPKKVKRPISAPNNQKTSRKGPSTQAGENKIEVDPRTKEKQKKLNKRREEILAQRKNKQRKPVEQKLEKAKELYELGLQQLKDNDLAGAAVSLKVAASYATKNKDYQQRAKEVNEEALRVRTNELTAAADLDLANGNYMRAARNYARASDLVPHAGSFAIKAAELYKNASDNGEALKYAERAVKVAPRRKEARLIIASLLEELGKNNLALSHLEMAASLDKSDARVKKGIKRLTKKVG